MINTTIVRLTMRQLLGQKRSILMLAFAALPILLALLYAAENDTRETAEFTAEVALGGFVLGLLLPFAALIFGTAALGQEFEDGTAVYLLAKPIPRATIVVSKLVVSWAATAVIVVLSTVPTTIIGLQGEPSEGMIQGFVVAGILGSLGYCAAFLWLSIATSRALIAGLLYVFIWESVVVNLFSGVKFLSIAEYAQGIAGAFVTAPERVYDPRLGPAQAFILLTVVTALSLWLAVRALRCWEIGEAT